MPRSSLTIDQVLTLLEDTPRRIAAATRGLRVALAFEPSFRAFRDQRASLMALLKPLPRSCWSRAATVTGAGAPLERTVLFYAEWVARHERPHVEQVERLVMARRQSATVGPRR